MRKNRLRPAVATVAVTLIATGCQAPESVSSASTSYFVDEENAPVKIETADQEQQIAELTQTLLSLGPSVDPREAARAARVAVQDPLVWAKEWQVVDPPLVHNFKVVNGLREKGVCQDFANAMHAALQAEGFQTLQIHRAMANAQNLLLEHATVVLSARGQTMEEGIILDPWRVGQGQLWYGRVAEDDRYTWESLATVHAKRNAFRSGL